MKSVWRSEGFSALFDYSYQWAYANKFEKAGLTALLGTGFDPGVTSVFVSYAKKHYFDRIDVGRYPRLQRRRPRLCVCDEL